MNMVEGESVCRCGGDQFPHKFAVTPGERCYPPPNQPTEVLRLPCPRHGCKIVAIGLTEESTRQELYKHERSHRAEDEIVEALQGKLNWFRSEAEVRDVIRIVRATIRRTSGE